ncbi:MAG: tyrosine-type recombinase/integrase [Lentisphaerota bacterium]
MKTTGLGYLFKRGKSGSKVKDSEPGIYYLQYTVNGSKKFMSLKTGNKVIAQKRRKKTLLPALFVDTSEKVILHIAEARKLLNNVKINLDDVWSKYENSTKRPQSSPGTLGNYKRMWKCFKEWLNAEHPCINTVNHITPAVAEEYSVFLWKKNIAENTYNYHLQALNLVLKIVTGELQTAFTGIKHKVGEQINRKDFTPVQVNKIFSVLNDKKFNIMHKDEMRLLCMVGLFTGLRLIDAALLKCESIDFDKNVLSVMPIKTRGIQRWVHIPIHPELRKELLKVEMSQTYVMPNVAERYLRNPTGVKLDFMQILDAAKLTDFKAREKGRGRRLYGYHSFRHTFASTASNSGSGITTLGSLLGDNPRTLEKYYIKVSDANKIKAVNSLPSIIKPSASLAVIDKDALPERVKMAILLIQELKISMTVKNQILALLQT